MGQNGKIQTSRPTRKGVVTFGVQGKPNSYLAWRLLTNCVRMIILTISFSRWRGHMYFLYMVRQLYFWFY